MIYLRLFLTFLEIGAVSFGGGYGMISLIREKVLGYEWLTEEEFLSFIAVSESTPGPLAINMATFIGSSQSGFWGALCATAGVVLPSFCIILLIAALMRNLLKLAGVNAALEGIRPAVVGLILGTALMIALGTLFGFSAFGGTVLPDWRGLAILAILIGLHALCRRFRHHPPSPILMILLSAGLGILMYG